MDILELGQRFEYFLLKLEKPSADLLSKNEKCDASVVEGISNFVDGNFHKIFHLDFAVDLLANLLPDEDANLENTLIARVERFLQISEIGKWESEFLILLLGAASLQLFSKSNWTGPFPTEHKSNFTPLLSNQDDLVRTYLAMDDETIYFRVVLPEYLLLAKVLLCSVRSHLSHCLTISRWCLRYICIHQQVMEERSSKLHSIMLEELGNVFPPEMNETSDSKQLLVQLHVEAFRLCLQFYESKKAKDYLHKAQEINGLNLNFTGALGKRTQHQQRAVAQLALRVERSADVVEDSAQIISNSDTIHQEDYFPKDLRLNDDVRLEKIKFNEDDFVLPKMSAEDQAIVLGLYIYSRKMNARHELQDEEIMSYLSCILSNPLCWPIQTMALLQRSKLEALHHRSMERSMMQIQTLIDHCKLDKPAGSWRLAHFYCSSLPPQWILEKELATMFRRLGANNSALDIYLRLQMWEEVISIYTAMQRRNKAEAVVREQLAIKETPTLWCHLGDATDDIEHYHKAWELSNHRSSRAQKSLGMYHFRRKEYDQCVPFLEKSVEVNPIQLDTWFSLAFASMQVENWDLAAKAYRRCINIEPDNFEAWNNLSNAYIKTNQKVRAWRSLQEALRCSYEDWRVWENYLLVSTDIGAFSEVIKAYHRILDLKEKHVDSEVLGILVKVVAGGVLDCEGKSASVLFVKLSELFGRLTSQVTSDSQVWKHYGRLIGSKDVLSPEDLHRVVQYLQKSHRFATFSGNWETDALTRRDVLELSLELANAYKRASSAVESVPSSVRQLLSSAKLMLNGVFLLSSSSVFLSLVSTFFLSLAESLVVAEESLVFPSLADPPSTLAFLEGGSFDVLAAVGAASEFPSSLSGVLVELPPGLLLLLLGVSFTSSDVSPLSPLPSVSSSSSLSCWTYLKVWSGFRFLDRLEFLPFADIFVNWRFCS